MEQRVSLITLGVTDVAKSKQFYEELGWEVTASPDPSVLFFQAGGIVVALWGRTELAADSGVTDNGGYGGITLAHNVRSPGEVDQVLEQATAAGAAIVRSADKTFWGGYSGVFTDLDGHPWEVAHNPFWTVEDDGSVTI